MIQTDSISRTMFAPSHLHRECPNSFRIASHSPAPGCRPSGTSGNSSSTRGCPTSPWIHLRSFWCPKEDLVSSAVPSNWERLAFISSPIRVIKFSSAPFYISYILYFFNQISTYLNSHLRVEESRDISFYLEKFCKCFPETFSNFAFSKSLSLPAELLVNRPPSVGLVEETLLSTVPENLMKSYLTLTHKDIEGT